MVERYDLPLLARGGYGSLAKGGITECAETIKPGMLRSERDKRNMASNRHAIDAVLREMTDRGFDCFCLTDSLKESPADV